MTPQHQQRRDSERLILKRRLLLRTSRGNVLQALARDLSVQGLGLRCDLATSYALNFDDVPGHTARGPEFEIRIGLPFASELIELHATGRLVHRRVNAQDDVMLGLLFSALDEENRDVLHGFIRYGLARAHSTRVELAPAPTLAVR
jgi:hypothetical protein